MNKPRHRTRILIVARISSRSSRYNAFWSQASFCLLIAGVIAGLVAGAVGYLDSAGDLDMAIAIRTAVMRAGKAYVQAAAGVVADSVPAQEEQETRNKARAVLQAIATAETLRNVT